MDQSSPGTPALRSPPGLQDLVTELRACARRRNHRRLLVLSGPAAWCRQTARAALALVAADDALWIGEPQPDLRSLPAAKAHTLLGLEVDMLAFDAYAGFDPDAFGAVAGALRGGGLMLLLTPPLSIWPEYPDPQRERMAVAPTGTTAVAGRFLARLARVLAEDPDAVIIEQGRALPVLVGCEGEAVVPPQLPSEDQRAAVAALRRVAEGHRRRPLVLVAHRGRGKSAAFGLAAAELLLAGPRRIVLTGPRAEAVEPAFRHAAQALSQAQRSGNELRYAHGVLCFAAPDELAEAGPPADLVLVDEAAALPTPLLTRLLERHARIAFATTVHGYEGTGRGFALRFQRELDVRTPGWRMLELTAPIRYAADDPLERLVFRALLLDAEPASAPALRAGRPARVQIEQAERDAFLSDEVSLAQLFGLLITAHYRTRPFDLRHLLDGPNLQVWLLRHQGEVVGTALVADEGGLEDLALAEAIRSGHRRVRGHLIPQSLAAHLGLSEALRLRCARVIRIAVHPAWQRQGLGRALVTAVVEHARRSGVDLLGSSFGATARLLRFWQGVGLEAVRVGATREATSGAHSLMMLRPLSADGKALCAAARDHFARNFPYQLAEPLRLLEPALAVGLLRGGAGEPALTLQESAALRLFASGGSGYEDCLAPLSKLAYAVLSAGELEETQQTLFLMKLLQRHDWQTVAQALGLTGRAAVMQALRAAVARVLPQETD